MIEYHGGEINAIRYMKRESDGGCTMLSEPSVIGHGLTYRECLLDVRRNGYSLKDIDRTPLVYVDSNFGAVMCIYQSVLTEEDRRAWEEVNGAGNLAAETS